MPPSVNTIISTLSALPKSIIIIQFVEFIPTQSLAKFGVNGNVIIVRKTPRFPMNGRHYDSFIILKPISDGHKSDYITTYPPLNIYKPPIIKLSSIKSEIVQPHTNFLFQLYPVVTLLQNFQSYG